MFFCCIRPPPPAPVPEERRKKRESRVRFREPNEVCPIDCREPSWLSYRSWSSLELEGSIERFIQDTLKEAAKSLQDESSTPPDDKSSEAKIT